MGVPGRPHPLSPQLCDPPTCHSRLFAAAGEPTHDKEGTALEGKALDKARKEVEKQKKVNSGIKLV